MSAPTLAYALPVGAPLMMRLGGPAATGAATGSLQAVATRPARTSVVSVVSVRYAMVQPPVVDAARPSAPGGRDGNICLDAPRYGERQVRARGRRDGDPSTA